MKFIGSRTDNRVDNAAGRVSELRAVVAALQLELLHGIRWRSDRCIGSYRTAAEKFDVVVDAVQTKIILIHLHAIDGIESILRIAAWRSGHTSDKLSQRSPI